MSDPLLAIKDIHTYYGDSYVLQGISMQLAAGRIVAILGRNGMGKTTLIRSVAGLTPPRSGDILFEGRSLNGCSPYMIAQQGIALVPQGRRVFSSLSVRENLTLPTSRLARPRPGRWNLQTVLEEFPQLQERIGNLGKALSGGEQQMLAIARILRTGARVLLLDEPTEGLAPVIVDRIGDLIRQLKGRGYTIVLVEQNVHFAAELADRHCLMESGRITDTFDAATLLRDFEAITARIGV